MLMDERLELLVEGLKETARENPFAFVVVAFGLLLAAVFWNVLLLVLRGFLYTAIALVVIFGAILLFLKLHYRSPSLKALFAEKKRLLNAIKIAERRYMQRKLSEKDFNKIFKEKQQRLIELEATIDQKYNREKKQEIDKELLSVQTKKRHILRSLLDEKKRVIKEMGIAEKRYLKRRIDAKTYQNLVQKNQQRLIELEASIREMYSEASISKVMKNLKQKIRELKKQKKTKAKKKATLKKEEQLQVALEIAEQVSKK